jgi:hypothetical protein
MKWLPLIRWHLHSVLVTFIVSLLILPAKHRQKYRIFR